MELTESIESINNQLIDLFGIDTVSGNALWRVVWSEDQLETRHGTYDDYTAGGLFIRSVTEWRLVPKYRQWIQAKYVLERLTVVPEINNDTLVEKTSYEPIYVFEDKKGNYLPPKIQAAKFVVDALYAAAGKRSLNHYVDEALMNDKREAEITKLEEELFGHEKNDNWLTTGEGIAVPTNYEGSGK